jgi:hypothetical protein
MFNSVFAVLLLSATVVAAGPIYTWQDEDGRVHFSDVPQSDNGQAQKTDMDTQMPVNTEQVDNEYSIRNQMEYFDQKREAQRQARLEEQQLKQTARAQELQAQQLEQQAWQAQQTPQTVVINQRPYYRPYYSYPRRYRPPYNRPPHYKPGHRPVPYHNQSGIQSSSPYVQRYLDRSKHHNSGIHTGNPYPPFPLNFWKY